MIDLGLRAEANSDGGDGAESAPRARHQPRQIESRHVLHHPTAGAHDLADSGHHLAAE